jgi:competence protein ComEA
MRLLTILFALVALLTAAPVFAQSVDVNTADAEELEELPGIGPKTAEAIVEDRDMNGPFATLEDLTRVPGVSSGLIAKLEGKARAGGSGRSSAPIVLREGEVVSAKVVRQILRKYAGEPSIKELQKAVLDYVDGHPEMIDSMRIRVLSKTALPELRSRLRYEIDDDLRTRTDLDATEATVETRDNDTGWRMQFDAIWDLDEFVFDSDELAITRESVRLANLRDRVLDEATRRYFERRRLQVDLELSPPRDLLDRVRKELRVQELTADLDSLTGGWFSEKLEAAGRKPY